MRIKAKDPRLVSLMGEFMRTYLPCVRNRDEDTIASYRYSINLFVTYLESEQKVTVLTMQSSDFSQKNIVEFMNWLKSERNNVAPTINHRLSDLRGFCKYLYKKNAISLAEYEAIREISDVDDERVIYFTWLSVNDVHLVLKSTAGNREAIRDRFLLSLLYESGARINEVLSLKLLDVKAASNREADVHFYGKERNIGSHLYPGKYGTSLKITVKNTIQTKLRRIYCFILSEMAGEIKCPVIMSAVYLQDVKKRFAKVIQT